MNPGYAAEAKGFVEAPLINRFAAFCAVVAGNEALVTEGNAKGFVPDCCVLNGFEADCAGANGFAEGA